MSGASFDNTPFMLLVSQCKYLKVDRWYYISVLVDWSVYLQGEHSLDDMKLYFTVALLSKPFIWDYSVSACAGQPTSWIGEFSDFRIF